VIVLTWTFSSENSHVVTTSVVTCRNDWSRHYVVCFHCFRASPRRPERLPEERKRRTDLYLFHHQFACLVLVVCYFPWMGMCNLGNTASLWTGIDCWFGIGL